MNPFCPKCGTVLMTKFRTWTEKVDVRLARFLGAKFWECRQCSFRIKKGAGIIG